MDMQLTSGLSVTILPKRVVFRPSVGGFSFVVAGGQLEKLYYAINNAQHLLLPYYPGRENAFIDLRFSSRFDSEPNMVVTVKTSITPNSEEYIVTRENLDKFKAEMGAHSDA